MPLYEYTCQACNHTFETMRPMSQADAPIHCPHCGSTDTTRELSAFSAFVRDGGGSRSVAGTSKGCAGCSASQCSTCKL